jgi:hypothetical protein
VVLKAGGRGISKMFLIMSKVRVNKGIPKEKKSRAPKSIEHQSTFIPNNGSSSNYGPMIVGFIIVVIIVLALIVL